MGRWALALGLLLVGVARVPLARAAEPEPSRAVSEQQSPSVEVPPASAEVGAAAPALGAEQGAEQGAEHSCVEAHERAQVERLEGRLLGARAELERCASDRCPAAIRRDCLGWKVELATAIPTVVIEALLDGKPASVAEVRIDAAPLKSFVPGLRVPLDPGPHRVAVRLTNGAEREVPFELRQGEQNRVLVVDFVTPAPPPAPVEERVEMLRPVPLVTWILLGTTLVGTGIGIAFGADALSQRSAAESSCSPLCDASVSESVQASAMASDIGWIVAGASAVGATVTYVLRPTIERPVTAEGATTAGRRGTHFSELAFETRSIPGGGLLRFSGSF